MSRRKADLEHVMRALARMHGDPSPALAMRVDQRIDLAVDFRLRERGDDEVTLPGAIALGLPMLDGAAAADAEMLAKRFNAFRAGLLDPEQLPPVRMMTRHGRDFHALAAQRIGNKNVLPFDERDTVAEVADMIDEQAFNHDARR